MDGPQHYRKAEQLLRAVERTSRNADPAAAARLIARAQVHALLALAAATATGTTAHAGQAWEDAAGTSPPMPDRPGSPPTDFEWIRAISEEAYQLLRRAVGLLQLEGQ